MITGQVRVVWVVAGLSGALLLGGCSGSASSDTSVPAESSAAASVVACESIQVQDVDTARGDWTLAEYVAVRGPEGTRFAVTLPPDAPASVAVGRSATAGSSQTRTEELTIDRASVTTDPASDLDPATLLSAIGQLDGTVGLSLTSTGESTGELEGTLGTDEQLVYRGFKPVTVTFTGDCSDSSTSPVPVTGSARFFDRLEVGILDCGQPYKTGTLAATAAQSCSTD